MWFPSSASSFVKRNIPADISLDGVHPSSQGQSLLATAAAQAISATYGMPIAVP
jgi:lysophospholipase L1-like esterase